MSNADMPAMPSGINEDYNNIAQEPLNLGLTKREHFAAMAMQGFCAFHGDGQSFDITAKESVVIADALLAELERTGGES